MKHEETHSNNGFTLDEATITRQLTLAKYIADTKGTDFVGFYAAIVPEVACPKLERVGSSGDGGKWTCNPFALPDNCVVYSLGVGMDISFEVQIDEIDIEGE
uniref:Methyltransferase domain-containing protein n=1 Tax=Plectus sambesii TaxID=2011161 RepID=A0A914V1P6_9BILA